MAVDQLRVIPFEDGTPGIRCPRCDSHIVPEKNEMFSDYSCNECGGAIDTATLIRYRKALVRFEEGESR